MQNSSIRNRILKSFKDTIVVDVRAEETNGATRLFRIAQGTNLVALTGDLPSQDGRFPLNFRIGGLLFILSVVVDFLVTMILIQIFYSN